jgi:hypothetical protein
MRPPTDPDHVAGPDLVQNDVTTYDQKVAVLLDDLRFETSLEHVAFKTSTNLSKSRSSRKTRPFAFPST